MTFPEGNGRELDRTLLNALMEKYKDVDFIVYDKDGIAKHMKGLWLLSDNGYPTSFSMFIIRYHDASTIENAFKVAGILHKHATFVRPLH